MLLGSSRRLTTASSHVDIVPTKIGQAAHVRLPAATSGEMTLTSMNGERRTRLIERSMDPPCQAVPHYLTAARLANNLERLFYVMGKNDIADQFKGFLPKRWPRDTR